MAEDPLLLKEDGYLNVDTDLKQIVYHPSLNVILICTDLEVVHVLDVNSGVVLQSSRLSAQANSKVTCKYLTGQDKILFCDGYGIGVRSDYNGVLLLDTILQKPVTSSKDVVHLELLLSEAVLLKQSLFLMNSLVIEQQTEVINELCEKILEAQKQSKKGIKAQKWNTVCLELPLDTLKKVAESTVQEFVVKNQHVPELAVAAAVHDRLNELLNEPAPSLDRASMASEARRRETFSRWPHMDYKWALPDQMAQAGFYHQPNSSGDDRAMCFTCTVCLVCWEKTDEPWSEHERHSPNCPFVMGEYTQNVPLSVTYATAPALDATYRGAPVSTVGATGVPALVATASSDGLVTVYDVSARLRRTHSFYVTQYDSPILECCLQEFGRNNAWVNAEQGRNVTITALSVVGKERSAAAQECNQQTRNFGSVSKDGSSRDAAPKYIGIEETFNSVPIEPKAKLDSVRPIVVCGLTIRCNAATSPSTDSPESVAIPEEIVTECSDLAECSVYHCLVVYDFQFSKDTERESELQVKKSSRSDLMSNIVMSMINDIDYSLMDVSNCSEEMAYINDMNYQALKMLKETETNNYQNLIPGESDKIYLPPLPKLVDDVEEEVDASSSLLTGNYPFINGPINNPELSAANEKSISDHISDLKNSKTKKLNYSHAVQCITLPAQYKNQPDLEIFQVMPTVDRTHILVVLRSTSGLNANVLLVFSLNLTGSVVKINDKPIVIRELPSDQRPVEVSVIPSVDKLNSSQFPDAQAALEGSAVIVCSDGVVRIVDLASMRLCVAKLEASKFVSAVYCNSLERLCAATANGSLHFYALNDADADADLMDDHEEDDYLCSLAADGPNAATPAKPDGLNEMDTAALSMPELRHLHSLCAFEPLSAAYCVVVPPCWSEMQQVQRQRRHPTYAGGDEQHTRTWRLQTDTTTWDEHIFELTLPWPVCIGHMDVHFSLHGQHSVAPHVEVTLLRQNTAGIGHRIFQVDEGLSFDFLQRNQNPVTSQEYLRSHNADILAGPVNLADCVDLSDQSGCVILTSPRLFRTNTRTLLLHIKALCDPSKEHSSRKEFKRNRDQPPGNGAVGAGNKAEYYMGCDCLHELSVTIYKTRHADAPGEKVQRSAMLESNLFFAKLLSGAAGCGSVQQQSLLFDMLLWLASVRLARNRGCSGEAPAQQLECVRAVEAGLGPLFRGCLLSSGRSIARKCVKFIVICSNGARYINDTTGQQFDNQVLQALLNCLPDIGCIWSAGALHWLVVLMLRVTRGNPHSALAAQCVTLLCQVAREIHGRTNPYHLLLRSRFGLFGTPLEPELFDVDPPTPAKSSSIPVTYASVVNGEQPASSAINTSFVLNDSSLDPKEVFVSPSSDTKIRLKSMVPNKHMRGLLETEPLHFACVSASDGTRVERFDLAAPPVSMSGLYGPAAVQSVHSQQTTGTKKVADSDDLKDKENIGMTELDITLEPVTNSSIELECKKITKLLLNAHEKGGSEGGWPVLAAGKMDGLEMTIEDPDIICIKTGEQAVPKASEAAAAEWGRHESAELLSPPLGKCSLQQLLVSPPQQVMVVERMQSGARRFVTLDLGAPVLLTDVIIPACHDLVSLSLDLWLRGEETDVVRLVLATDIGTRTLVLNDLQPPPICRFVKITTIGRYGMSTTRCKIPIGNFYGHIIVLPDEVSPDGDLSNGAIGACDVESQVNVLAMLLEDVSCRYSLACSRLKDLLHPLLTSDIPNSVHMAAYMSIVRDTVDQGALAAENVKVFTAYQEALMYQRQLNIVQGVMRRIERFAGSAGDALTASCTDKLRAIAESLLDILLSLPVDASCPIELLGCRQLFRGLCVAQGPRVQMLAATLLVRFCGRQPYWGDFIADTLAQMFSSDCTTQFPQDRVFVLLAYLGRKSPERGAVLDATLRVLAEVLSPLGATVHNSLLAVSTDLSLLGWILLYLSLQLDGTSKADSQTARRWNWVTGDTSAKAPGSGVCTGSHRRKVHRRFIHYKQQIDQLDWTKKAVQASTQVQALSALSSQAASLSSKLEAALKQQEHVFKRIKQISTKQKETAKQQESGSSKDNRSSSWDQMDTSSSISQQLAHSLNPEHCLAVTRGIVTLLLAMDHSCSADMFLLACKVLARLVTMAQLSIAQLCSGEQLQQLMRVFVRGDQPWIQHALACLLQDMLEVPVSSASAAANAPPQDDAYESAAAAATNNDMDTDAPPAGPSWGPLDTEIFETFSIEEALVPDKVVDSQNKVNNSNLLPSVFESDDSELDDFLDDILERGRSLLRRNGAAKTTISNGSISSAMDARLELGVETTAEIQLRRLTSLATSNLLQHLSSSPGAEAAAADAQTAAPAPWSERLLAPWARALPADLTNSQMLSACFNALFNEMQLQSSSHIENTARLWLTLNKTSSKGSFNPSLVPAVAVSAQSVSSLVSALVYSPSLSLRTWCVSLQALTLMCNMPAPVCAAPWPEPPHGHGTAGALLAHPEFVAVLLRLLSGSGLTHADRGQQAGPSVCRALHELLSRLQTRAGAQLSETLLRLLLQLVQPSGPLALRQGPLDVQCKFLQTLLQLDFGDAQLGAVLCIVESAGVLVSSYVSNVDRIRCVNLGERNGGAAAANSFGGLFASVLGSDSSKQDRPASWESLLIALLKLLTKLVQTPVAGGAQPAAAAAEPMDQSQNETEEIAQTDECKAELRERTGAAAAQPPPARAPCLADGVLQQHASVMRLCHSLAACSGSSLAMLVGCAQQIGLTDIGEPTTVGDAVFQLLSVMAQKTSRPALVLEPLVLFLRSAQQLSEPLLWFVLQALGGEPALRGFLALGGVRALADSLVASGRALGAAQHGTVSLVMHHMASAAAAAAASACGSAAGGAAGSRSDATLSYAAPSFSKKVQQASMENAEALVNFAPLGSIRCHSGTAQPADVLIQSAVAPHRRARTPQWCYHFYPDETHTDLTIRLPCAVLLREVQLQPHVSSLSTCPSAVALEVSNGGPDHLVPASPPLPTSGMTFIRLHLPQPEVVTHVLLRLYKPRDASNIGLSQIRLLGTSAFGGSRPGACVGDPAAAAVSEEEACSRFSLGWLRLLHHCLVLPPPGSPLERAAVAAAAAAPDLLTTCCGLLLVPTHIPPLYLPELERVLCKLALHDRASGLQAIRLLLDSKAALAGGGAHHAVQHATSRARLGGSPAAQSVCELLYQICGHQDADTRHRVAAVLAWLAGAAERAARSTGERDGCSSAAFVSCIASVLWAAGESGVAYPLRDMVTRRLFDATFAWTRLVHAGSLALKNALDCLLCSLCYVKNELFPLLLQRMGVLVPNLSTDLTASISDDRKDAHDGMTDDTKQVMESETEWYGRLVVGELSQLELSEAQLRTVAMVGRSPVVVQQLLDSGLPRLLIAAVLEFCNDDEHTTTVKVPMARLENVTAVLKFLADICSEQSMRDWLGSPDGSSFWLPLLRWLCRKQAPQLKSEPRAQLEDVCVRFLARCCLCHAANQRLLARVLCEVIGQQLSGISGFMRRLVLQLLLENEKIPVCIRTDESVYKTSPVPQPSAPHHPAYKCTHDRAFLHLSTDTTIGEILEQHIAFATTIKTAADRRCPQPPSAAAAAAQTEVWEIGLDGSDHASVAAGVTAKDKRAKDVKNQALSFVAPKSSTPKLKKKRYAATAGGEAAAARAPDAACGRAVRCEALPERALPLGLTLAQLLALLEAQPAPRASDRPCLHLTVSHCGEDDRATAGADADALLQARPIGNALQAFSAMGGLALLAQHLPTVYPELAAAARPAGGAADKPPAGAEQPDTDWVKVEGSDDIYEDLEDAQGTSQPAKSCGAVANVPPHSLTAFGLFLRLPGYAEVLLRDSKRALCLLRLVLGVTDDGEGGDVFLSPVADSLPTLPFEVLRRLYDGSPLGTDDGRLLRAVSIDVGVTQLLLGCLAVFTHQQSGETCAAAAVRTDDKSSQQQLYWAKGTGFGTGSTQQSWNVEQALLRQRSEEQHVTVLLQVLASYVSPGGGSADCPADDPDGGAALPSAFEQQLSASCLLPALSSYLRNDSVLDMARHIPLYRAVLQLLRAVALSRQLVELLLPAGGATAANGNSTSAARPPSVVALLQQMKCCVDNYTCRLRFNKNSTNKFKFAKYSTDQSEESETDEGLALLMPDIQETANLVQQATNQILGHDHPAHESSGLDPAAVERPLQQSLEQRYLDVMRRLQFDTFEMISETADGYKFVVSYHFEGNVRSAGEQSQPARVKRLAQEAVTLATSLPLSYSSSVFVRCDADRLDIMKVLITGPADTPYANGCFEFDVYFPPDYPNAPMLINLETTGHHTVRFNPNLYNDGKVCLSVLNTWHGRPEEKWNAQTSSFLQVLVSIQSLILVPEPYFNEPGYERSRGTPSGTQSSREYNTNICQATVRWAMLEQIANPCPCFRRVIHAHFWLKRREVLAQAALWVADLEAQLGEKRGGGRSAGSKRSTTAGSLESFRKNYQQLREQLSKLRPPEEGLAAEEAAAAATTDAMDMDMEKLVSEVCE